MTVLGSSSGGPLGFGQSLRVEACRVNVLGMQDLQVVRCL